ncbi:MAG: hypothetical protein GX066_04405 [Clostridiaceae bacterium]|nr:hypothetical protein [Clostridiaceae bacterium]
MSLNRTLFYVTTFIIMLALSALTKNVILSGVVTFALVMTGYILIAYLRTRKRLSLLEEKCDPKAFLERTEKQKQITGKDVRIGTYLSIDIAVAYMEMGEFQKAKEILLSIDRTKLSAKKGTLLVYYIDLISCYYELGEIPEAEKLFETEIVVLPPLNKRMTLSVNILVAERFFFLKRYDESKKKFNELLNEKLSRRRYLSILYRLAQIDEKTGDMESARIKYNQVAEQGNKLWIAEEAKKHC